MDDEKKIHTLIIDQDFRRLCPDPATEEYTNMEEEIVYRGCPHPIEVWHDMVMYDFMIYDICQKWEIPFRIHETNFPTKPDAIYYACKTLLDDSTREHSDIYYRYLVGRAFNAMKKVMVDVQYGRRTCPYPVPSLDDYKKYRRSPTSIIAGEIFHLSAGTVSQYGSYAKALDTIADKVPAVAEEIFTKQISFGIETTIKLSQGTNAEILMERDRQKKGYQKSIVTKLGFTPEKPAPAYKMKKKKDGPEIKQMPKYDPDAELSSLSLTIPTWISSMKRTQSIANFKEASPEAVRKLESKLISLTTEVREIITMIREETTNGE